jgi:hypothetical protein
MQEGVGEDVPVPPIEEEPETEAPADKDKERESAGRGDRIGVGGGDDSVARFQLAARWAETFAPENGDNLRAALRRFRTAYEYLDSVTHGIEPPSENGEAQ